MEDTFHLSVSLSVPPPWQDLILLCFVAMAMLLEHILEMKQVVIHYILANIIWHRKK